MPLTFGWNLILHRNFVVCRKSCSMLLNKPIVEMLERGAATTSAEPVAIFSESLSLRDDFAENESLSPAAAPPLKFTIVAACPTSKARASLIRLPHSTVKAPVFMPVGTKGTLKGMMPEQVKKLGIQLSLANTYHLALSPGPDVLARAGGLHKWANWDRSMLTDSGGFQMVSLLELAKITEEGVHFRSPYATVNSDTKPEEATLSDTDEHDNKIPKQKKRRSGHRRRSLSPKADETTVEAEAADVDRAVSTESDASSVIKANADDDDMMLLTPEESIRLQNSIGADIIMQLDDVVSSLTSGPRVAEAMHRTVRWLDRCNAAHARRSEQCLFPIVQGGLSAELRRECIEQMLASHRDSQVLGYAIGGLSGGEAKDLFWRMVSVSTDILPPNKPRYVMGVGYAVDLVVCVALGADMFDCVFPTRTARFGGALIRKFPGQLSLRKPNFAADLRVIDAECACPTCREYRKSRAFLHTLIDARSTNFCRYITLHNLHFMQQLMTDMNHAIIQRQFPAFVQQFMYDYYYRSSVSDAAPTKNNNMDDEPTIMQSTLQQTSAYPWWVVEALASVGIQLLPLL